GGNEGGTQFMNPESWLIVTVSAGFLLVGIAASPMAWVIIYHRRSRFEELMAGRWGGLSGRGSGLEALLTRADTVAKPGAVNGAPVTTDPAHTPRGGAMKSSSGPRFVHPASTATGDAMEPALIAVPALPEAENHRESLVSGLAERF